MRTFLLPLFILLTQYTITMSAAPVTTTLENFRQILSDLVIPQEQQNGTAAAKAAAPKQSTPLGIRQIFGGLPIPSNVTNGTKIAPTVTILANEANLNQLQITRALPPGKRFRASNRPAREAAAKRSQPTFHVPNTNVILIFRLGVPMRQDVMQRAIVSAMGFVQGILDHGGDGPLPQAKDPWIYGPPDNDFSVIVRSLHNQHELTWRIVETTLLGLWDFLYLNGRFQESLFNIYDSTPGHGGHVGKGALIARRATSIRNFTQRLSGDQNLWSTTRDPTGTVNLSR